MTSILICYCSYSGNTLEVAELLAEQAKRKNIRFHFHEIEYDYLDFSTLKEYDYILLGAFTWGEGRTPDEVKDFVLDIGYKPKHIAVFGTGETQFGDHYCRAVDKLSKFYHSQWEGLKIEQSPRGSQEGKVTAWFDYVVK